MIDRRMCGSSSLCGKLNSNSSGRGCVRFLLSCIDVEQEIASRLARISLHRFGPSDRTIGLKIKVRPDNSAQFQVVHFVLQTEY
jgi:hypothetical protein